MLPECPSLALRASNDRLPQIHFTVSKQQVQLSRIPGRWACYEVVAINDLGNVPMAEVGAEFLFQVIAERDVHAIVLLTTDLPFSE